MEGAGADFEVERLDQHAALRRPVGVEALDRVPGRWGRWCGSLAHAGW